MTLSLPGGGGGVSSGYSFRRRPAGFEKKKMTIREILLAVKSALVDSGLARGMTVSIAVNSALPFLRAPRGNGSGDIVLAYDGTEALGQTPHGKVPVRSNFSAVVASRVPMTLDAAGDLLGDAILETVEALEAMLCNLRLPADGSTETHTRYDGTDTAEVAGGPGVSYSTFRIRFSVARAIIDEKG